MKIRLLIASIACAFFSYGQTYNYTFEGSLSPENLAHFEQELNEARHVRSAKVRYKADLHRGEILLITEEKDENFRAEGYEEFQPVTIKGILLKYGLSPIDFRTIRPTQP